MKYKVTWIYYTDQDNGTRRVLEADFYSNIISALFRVVREAIKDNNVSVEISKHSAEIYHAC